MNYELYLCLHRRSTLLLQKCTILSFLFVVVNCYSTFPTKTCALCWSLETSAIDVRLLHDTLNSHSPWLITFFQQSELLYWGFRPSNISCNGCSYVKRQVIYSFVAASSWVIMSHHDAMTSQPSCHVGDGVWYFLEREFLHLQCRQSFFSLETTESSLLILSLVCVSWLPPYLTEQNSTNICYMLGTESNL